ALHDALPIWAVLCFQSLFDELAVERTEIQFQDLPCRVKCGVRRALIGLRIVRESSDFECHSGGVLLWDCPYAIVSFQIGEPAKVVHDDRQSQWLPFDQCEGESLDGACQEAYIGLLKRRRQFFPM